MSQNQLQLRTLSSLAKVFPKRIVGVTNRACRAVHGQEISFQVAYRGTDPTCNCTSYRVEISSPIRDWIQTYTVDLVPSFLPVYPTMQDDGNYLSRKPGLFPDPLTPLQGDLVNAFYQTWRTLWFSVKIPEEGATGDYPVEVRFFNKEGVQVEKTTYRITVEPYALPAAKLLYTQWFHCDCIADVHRVPVLSEAHWSLIEKYMRLAAQHGMNMILTPVITPPLDTAVGSERPTVQLVGVEKVGEDYTFDCTQLRRYIKMALDVGITHFEISHFFTQWGAGYAPKVVAKVNGRTQKLFGWNTAADDPSYVAFLRALVPAVIDCFAEEGVPRDRLWFHVSDEPNIMHLEQYRKAEGILRPLIEGCHHIDALSDYDFYTEKLVEHPVVATDHIGTYLEANVSDLWCYYCCGQGYKLSNRFFAMPSARTRILGVQIYKYNIAGFLQWGYNFYYKQLSKGLIDPYAETDAGAAFPSGDAFSVYPFGNDVIPSLRQKVFANALEDIRLLNLLEEKLGRKAVIALIERVAGMEITFAEYPHEEAFFADLYDAIFAELQKSL